jgi:hypothetical protein
VAHAPRIGQKAAAGIGQVDAARMALEQRRAQLALELADARGNVRLHGVELGGRAVHAAQPRHRLEHPQVACIHGRSPSLDGAGCDHSAFCAVRAPQA